MMISSRKNRANHSVVAALFIITGDENIIAGGNVTVYKAPTNKQYAAFRITIQQEDWDATKNNPAFRKLVRAVKGNVGRNVRVSTRYANQGRQVKE